MREGSWIGKLGSSTAPNAVASKQAVPVRMVRFSLGMHLGYMKAFTVVTGSSLHWWGTLQLASRPTGRPCWFARTHFPNSRSLSPLLSTSFRPIRPGRPTLRATMDSCHHGFRRDRRSAPPAVPKRKNYQTNPFFAVAQTNKISYVHPIRTHARPTYNMAFLSRSPGLLLKENRGRIS